MNPQAVIFEPHSNKHGYTPEDIVYAAEHVTKIESVQYKGATYVRYTGEHIDALAPQLGVVLKLTPQGTIHVYHADTATSSFWDIPFKKWITK